MPKVTPFLWFNDNAAEAVELYASVFPGTKMTSTMPGPNDTIMGGSFELLGREFQFLNGGPRFPFTEAFSMFVSVETQAEVDEIWNKLVADGFPAEPIKVHGQDKRARLAQTTHLIESGKILFPQRGAEELLTELIGFGVEPHDDLVDAFSMLIMQIIDRMNRIREPRVFSIKPEPFRMMNFH